jgi:glycosyltransferase involved in cell wall biosynthesis
MRLLHVVSLISPDGAYGGPVRVSFNLARELISQGHDVVVAAACLGYDPMPEVLDGIPVRLTRPWHLLPGMGFAALASPKMLWWMLRQRCAFDVVHVHLARDLITLPAAILAILMRKRLVVQPHGMIIESARRIAPLMDWLLTRPVLRRADCVLYLTEDERGSLLQVEPRIRLMHLPNGVPRGPGPSQPRRDVVEVLYLARLHERKRPRLFVEAAADLLREGTAATFTLIGPDGGEAANVENDIAGQAAISYDGALPPAMTLDRMRRASIYVLPSVDEPFPMSVLEAMSVGLPVVITDSCGLAGVVTQTGSGFVTDGSKQSLVDAMRTLIGDSALRDRMGAAARRTAEDLFSMEAVAQTLVSVYRDGSSVQRQSL